MRKNPRAIFPGRVTLYLREAARFLGVTEQDVITLIEAGQLGATNIFELSTGKKLSRAPRPGELRITIEALEAHVKAQREEPEREE